MAFTLKPLGNIGREVQGLRLEGGMLSPADGAALREAWHEHGVLLFRGLAASPEVHLALSRAMGTLEPHPIATFRLPGYPELILLTNEDGRGGPLYDFDGVPTCGRIPWHTDLAFATTPNAGAVLRMVKCPARGGDTGWIDTAAAYDALDEKTKEEIAGLEAIYLFHPDLEGMRFNRQKGRRLDTPTETYPDFPPVANPLVWIHPETGRKVLNLSTLNIDHVLGLPQKEGDALIERLLAHTLQPAFQYVHHWQEGDMILWDNRRTMHQAFGYPAAETRIVHRTTIKGTVAMGRLAA